MPHWPTWCLAIPTQVCPLPVRTPVGPTTIEWLLDPTLKAQPLTVAGSEPPIGGGSRLNPIEALLRVSLESAAQRVVQLAMASDLVQFHNGYVAYVAVALFAATGARPVRDPFESFAHFDFDQHFCLLNDKSSGDTRSTRITPLPRQVAEWVRIDYCRYLDLLAQTLEPAHPGLAANIGSLGGRSARPAMPFLFMLTEEGGLSWTSVTESAIVATNLFDWPLPLRLFRHRLAQRLRRRGVDPEVIDSILGHADNAVASHGDESTRIWLDDMTDARVQMEGAFADIGMPLIKCQPRLIAPVGRASMECDEDELFGIRARERDREVRSEHARNDAAKLIEEFLTGRQLPELDGDAVDDLATKLLFSSQGLPRPLAHIYYDVFASTLDGSFEFRVG